MMTLRKLKQVLFKISNFIFLSCTFDHCDTVVAQCINIVNHTFCNDGDACTVDLCTAKDSCDNGCEYTPLNCDDDIAVCIINNVI